MKSEASPSQFENAPFTSWNGAICCALLVLVAMLMDRAVVSHSLANILSLLVILTGLVWTGQGPKKLLRLSEWFLWLAFILSLSLLKIWSDSLARWLGLETMTTFQMVAVAFVCVVAAALWKLGAWSRGTRQTNAASFMLRLASGLLVLGAVVFWVGARTFPGSGLEAISTHLAGHMWTSGNFVIATMITLVGLACFTLALREKGDRFLSIFGWFTYQFGAIFWILHLAFRLTVVRQAAEQFSSTAIAPAWFQAWGDWSGLLFGIYSVLAYLSIALYGVAVLRTGLLPRWIGWTCILVGVMAAPLAGPPFFIHVLLWFVSMMAIRQGASWQTTRPPGRMTDQVESPD